MSNLGNVDKLQTLLNQLVGSAALAGRDGNCGWLGNLFIWEKYTKKNKLHLETCPTQPTMNVSFLFL